LPRHRGIDPFFWTIYNEEEYSGITFHFIVEKIDKGAILFQKKYKIKDNESVTSLYKELLKMGEDEILYYLQNGKFSEAYVQNENEKIDESIEKAVPEEFFQINENMNSDKIRKLFKAIFFTFEPYILVNNEKIKFSKYEIISENNETIPGNIFILKRDNSYFKIKTSDNKIIKLFK
jgi:methionyl-tRNA formyltransferase